MQIHFGVDAEPAAIAEVLAAWFKEAAHRRVQYVCAILDDKPNINDRDLKKEIWTRFKVRIPRQDMLRPGRIVWDAKPK